MRGNYPDDVRLDDPAAPWNWNDTVKCEWCDDIMHIGDHDCHKYADKFYCWRCWKDKKLEVDDE